MNRLMQFLCAAITLPGLAEMDAFAQTDGGARLETTILDYNGSSTRHWTVVWVTTTSGTFIKSLRKQGPSWTSTHWDSHCAVWNAARGGSASGSQALDGYSSATAPDYTGTNSPIVWTWNCRDANNNLMPDGSYKFWVQYAEDNGQGPYTTNGLVWTKGPSAATTTYANMGASFSNLKVVWTPTPVRPTFTSVRDEGDNLVMSGTGPANGTYAVLVATNANTSMAQWLSIATGSIAGDGKLSYTNALDPSVPRKLYRLRSP